MKLFPFKEITIDSALSAEDAHNQLAKHAEVTRKWYQHEWPFEKKPFKGKVEKNKFKLTSTSLLPGYLKIVGEISQISTGSQIKIKVKNLLPSLSAKLRNIVTSIITILFLAMFFASISDWFVNVLIIIHIIIISGVIYFIKKLNDEAIASESTVINNCLVFFHDIFNGNISYPYEIQDFIQLTEK
ncbi:hypothetical protein KAR91_05940, partial [Candidatus Pacearchaeota archaeon]|nr:hypothetical protein [Candidatus Pacearchaeota archaeon]